MNRSQRRKELKNHRIYIKQITHRRQIKTLLLNIYLWTKIVELYMNMKAVRINRNKPYSYMIDHIWLTYCNTLSLAS